MPGPKITTLSSIAVGIAADSKMKVSKPEQYMPERFRITGRVYVCFMKVKKARTGYVKVGPVPFRVLAQKITISSNIAVKKCSDRQTDRIPNRKPQNS